jgi:hypothetical protein
MNLYFAKRVKGYEKLSGMNDKVIDPLITKENKRIVFSAYSITISGTGKNY